MGDQSDWLFNVQEQCDDGDDNRYDVLATSMLSRIVFISTYTLACVLIFYTRRQRAASSFSDVSQGPLSKGFELVTEEEEAEEEITAKEPSALQNKPSQDERLWHLDYCRILCVWCIVTEHAADGKGGIYAERNVAFVLQWVMPYIWLISGTSLMLSKSTLNQYLGRLGALFVVGVAANWMADINTGRNWRGDFGDTIFQMFYVVFLAVAAVVSWPLRCSLLSSSHAEAVKGLYLPLTAWTALLLVSFGTFMQGKELNPPDAWAGDWTGNANPIIKMLPMLGISTCGMLVLISFSIVVGPSSLTGWILLAVVYLPRVVQGYARAGAVHNLELYLLSMLIYRYPLAGRREIIKIMQAYWILSVAVLCLLSMPGTSGRCDLFPPFGWWFRLRFYFIEFVFALAFLTGALNSSDPYGVTKWAGQWSIFAYCFHVAWARLFWHPWGTVLTYGSLVIFFANYQIEKAWDDEATSLAEKGVSARSSAPFRTVKEEVSELPHPSELGV